MNSDVVKLFTDKEISNFAHLAVLLKNHEAL